MSGTLAKKMQKIQAALAWRFRRLVGDTRLDNFIIKVAHRCRPWLKHTQVVGIIGSAGKTTTKELLHGMLATKMRGTANPSSLNAPPEVAKTILRAILRRDYCVVELSEDRPGVMDATLPLLRPNIGIVTVVRDDHLAAFESRDGLALEMEKLVRALPASGTAVLNADEERVLAMAEVCKAKVITYGVSANAELRAEEVSSDWPKRLQMTLVHGTTRVRLETQLCGTHWLPSVLGAIGGGLAAGLTLNECAAGIAKVEPFEGRMQPVNTADGVTFIRDDFKAPYWTLDSCFAFMVSAKAPRKILVIGELSDIDSKKEKKYAKTAVLAQQSADLTIYVGPWASSVLRARDPAKENCLHVFSQVKNAAEFLNSITREGDLVLLKGSVKQDHLLRTILARSNLVACWRDDCQRNNFCDQCPERMKPSGKPAASLGPVAPVPASTVLAAPAMKTPGQFIVGLGNPGDRYARTPHNVGYDALDLLAEHMALTWQYTQEATYAQGTFNDQPIFLVKVQAPMNLIGASLKHFADTLHFSPEQCILVFDDLDLPVGTVKTRQRGSAGGHKGVASILEAFQTDAFRRIKIGVGQTDYTMDRAQYVLVPFDPSDQILVDAAIAKAVTNIRSMLRHVAT